MARHRSPALVIALCWLVAGPVGAVDGVIEVNQAKVEIGGVTPGDDPGFPLTLDAAGSYVLTSDLTTTQATTALIRILADDVTLDFNGFTVSGPNRCTVSPGGSASCTEPSSEPGLYSSGSRTVLRKGRIVGSAGWGIGCQYDCTVENMGVHHSKGDGLIVNGVTRSCTSTFNLGAGFSASGLIVDSVASQNGGMGIMVTGGSHGARLTAGYNLGVGLQLGDAVSVQGCAVNGNGDGAVPEHGVVMLGGSLLTDCAIAFNKLKGISVPFEAAAFARNALRYNNSGGEQLEGSLVALGSNLCGAALCP